MHKLKLSELNLSDAEVLTRDQLKKVLGGDGSGGGSMCNQCCYNDYPNDCSTCNENSYCPSGQFLRNCLEVC